MIPRRGPLTSVPMGIKHFLVRGKTKVKDIRKKRVEETLFGSVEGLSSSEDKIFIPRRICEKFGVKSPQN